MSKDNFHDLRRNLPRVEKMMTDTSQVSKRKITPLLFRFMVLTLIVVATPSIAHADQFTQMGLDRLAESVGYLAAAIAFAGIVIAMAVFLGLKSRRQD
jgi:hypothetical protein